MAGNDQPVLYCSFCGKSQHEVSKLVAGPSVFICDECVELCGDIVREEKRGTDDRDEAPIDLDPIAAAPEIKHALLLWPLAEPFDTICKDHVDPAVKAFGMATDRADDIFGESRFEDLWARISSAAIVIADVTGRRPDVMYELGMAHAAGIPTMILTQNIDDVPFGEKLDRCVVYSHTPRGCAKLADSIRRTLLALRP